MDTVLCHWNHIWLRNYPVSTKEFEKKTSLCCTRLSKWSHKKHNPFRSHSGFSSVVAAQGLDSVRPFSSQAEQDFSPRGWGYSWGKIPAGHNKIYSLDVFEWIQSPQRGCHRSLAMATWWRKVRVKMYCCLGIPPHQRSGIMEVWEFGADVFKYDTVAFHTLSSSALKIIFAQFRNQSDSHYPSPDKISASTKRRATKHYPWSVTAVLIFLSSLSQSHFFPTTA